MATGSQVKMNVKPKIRTKADLEDEIQTARKTGKYYIGKTKVSWNWKDGKAVEAMYECEGRTRSLSGSWSASKHPVDENVMNKKLKLVKVICTRPLKAKNAEKLYIQLLNNYSEDRLRISHRSTDELAETGKEIVYLRIYVPFDAGFTAK